MNPTLHYLKMQVVAGAVYLFFQKNTALSHDKAVDCVILCCF